MGRCQDAGGGGAGPAIAVQVGNTHKLIFDKCAQEAANKPLNTVEEAAAMVTLQHVPARVCIFSTTANDRLARTPALIGMQPG